MTIYLAEYFDGRFVVKKSRNNVSIIGGVLFANHHSIAVTDGGVDHRISFDAQHKELAAANQLFGEGKHILNGLLCRDGPACRYATYQRDRHHILVADFKGRQLRNFGRLGIGTLFGVS